MLNTIKYFIKRPLQLPIILLTRWNPYFSFLYKKTGMHSNVNFEFWFKQKILNWGGNKEAYWPVHWTSKVYDPKNVKLGINSAPGSMGGAYITGTGGLTIGNYCLFAKNIVIVTADHDLYDSRKSNLAPVAIGSYCWMGAGAKIMPGVRLGDYTIVAAGAVVTKSFPEGFCVIGGVPAKKIKELDKTQCAFYENKHKYIGYKLLKECLDETYK